MRVILEAPLFSSKQVSLNPLALFSLFDLFVERECHSLEIDPPESPGFYAWRETLSESVWDEIELVLGESTKRQLRDPPMNIIRVADVQEIEWVNEVPRFPLRAAISLLHRPLRVLMEGVNDEAFLRSAVPQFYRARFEDWSKRGLLTLEAPGGLPNLQHTLRQERQVRERRLRLFVMFDSDARKRGEPSRESNDVARLCARARMTHHQLERRAIENYLPEPALSRWVKQKYASDFDITWLPRLRAFRELTEEQRHHYNMKGGLKKDREGSGLADIFESLVMRKPDHALLLEGGFGEVARCFHEDNIPEAWRVSDGQHTELMNIFEKLLRAA